MFFFGEVSGGERGPRRWASKDASEGVEEGGGRTASVAGEHEDDFDVK